MAMRILRGCNPPVGAHPDFFGDDTVFARRGCSHIPNFSNQSLAFKVFWLDGRGGISQPKKPKKEQDAIRAMIYIYIYIYYIHIICPVQTCI